MVYAPVTRGLNNCQLCPTARYYGLPRVYVFEPILDDGSTGCSVGLVWLPQQILGEQHPCLEPRTRGGAP